MPKADDYRPLDETRPMRIVEVEDAPCQHLHASNYDPAEVVQGQPVQVLGDGLMWCFDCSRFFRLILPPRRYTLAQVEQLIRDYCDEWEHKTESTQIEFRLGLSLLIEWLKKREREVGDGN